jgi:predicted transposase/invertase (TIGR01784 family)
VTEFFKAGAAEFFGVSEKILYPLETEVNHLEQKQLFSDLVFWAENNTLVHFEFQSTSSASDLYRFCLMDAYLLRHHNVGEPKLKIKHMETHVIYTGEIKKATTEFSMGPLKYSVIPFYMSNYDGDKKYLEISKKIKNHEELTSEDLYSLTLLPLMKISRSKEDMIEESMKLGGEISDENTQSIVMGSLDMLADKFIKDPGRLERVRRRMSMTKVGRMLLDEGEEKGRAESLAKAASRMFRKGLNVREIADWLGVPEDDVERMLHLKPA